MQGKKCDALLLDWNVPDMSGVGVIAHVRTELQSNVPSVVVTARNAEEDIVQGLKQGADDYICKPTRPKELLARLDAVTKLEDRLESADLLDFGWLVVDVAGGQALLNNQPVTLSVKDFDLAVFLLRSVGRVLSRRNTVHAVWSSSVDVTSRTLETHVSRVRSNCGSRRPTTGTSCGVWARIPSRAPQLARTSNVQSPEPRRTNT